MRLIIFSIITFFTWQSLLGQTPAKNRLVSSVTVDKNFKDTLTFTKKWDYPWYIVVSDDGSQMENTLGGVLTETDTIHLYHTANCWTNHQGRHRVRYCNGILNNGTIEILFQPELPAYSGKLNVSIKNGFFWSNFSATYPAPAGQLSWIITKQKLVLDKNIYKPGDTIKGYLEVGFTEMNLDLNEKLFSKNYYYKGYFKTLLLKGD
jgi:hypothetical protein